MTRKAWLDRIVIPPKNIHPMPTDADDPVIAAATYEAHLQAFFGLAAEEFPQFDLVLLGMGDDGHTASLFPGTDALKVRDRLVTVGKKDDNPRITLTAPTINRAKQIVFMVEGAAKNKALQGVLATEGDSNVYPSRLIEGSVTWLVDPTASANIQA
jgi:6-phosphogluconolactonase